MESWRIHEHSDGWYFEDNLEECYGPYVSAEEAWNTYVKFSRYFEGNCPTCGEQNG